MGERTPVLVTVERWTCRLYGPRWTLSFEGRPLITRATRAEVEAVAREYGWRIESTDNEYA